MYMIEVCPHCLKRSYTWGLDGRICMGCEHIFVKFRRDDYYHFNRGFAH